MPAKRLACIALTLSTLWALAATPALAQEAAFPNRPITIIWPFPSGPAADTAFRAISTEVSKILGQPLIYESRPGARSRLGLNAMVKAPADGYLLNIVNDGHVVSQPIADPDFKMALGKEYVPVAFAFQFPLILSASAMVPFRDIKGLIAYAKANPGKLNVAITQATTTHFMSERFRQAAGIDFTLIPYKGSEWTTDLATGRVDLAFVSTSIMPFIVSGKAVGLATTGAQRWSAFPDVPTLSEQGVSMPTTVWWGVVAHAGTPAPVIAKLNNAFNAALKIPEIRKRLDDNGFSTGTYTSPDEFSAFIRAEMDVWRPVIQKAGIKLE